MNFLRGLLTRTPRHADKPTDFADLQKLHKAWRKEGAQLGDSRTGQLHDLATRYLSWAAEQQHPARKLQDRRRLVAGMVAETAVLIALTPMPTRSPRNLPERARSISPSTSSSSSSSSSSASSASSGSMKSKGSSTSTRSKESLASRFSAAAVASAQTFRHRLNPPSPDSFTALSGAYERFTEKQEAAPFDETEALQVRQLAENYLKRHGDAGRPDAMKRSKLDLAAGYRWAVDAQIEKERWQRQWDIDTACPQLHAANLTLRTTERQKHAVGMIRRLQWLNRADDGTSDRLILRADGTPQYRFMPMPTRDAVHRADQGPQHAVLASILHRTLVEQVDLDLRLPCATNALIDGVPGVLADVVDHPSPEATSLRAPPAAELQRAVLAQWVLGRPRAKWGDVGMDEQGRLRPRHLPLAALSLRDIAAEGLSGVSPMLFAPGMGHPMPGLHRPVDATLADALLRLDVDKLAQALAPRQDQMDLGNAANAVRARQRARHLPATHKDAVDRLLEPLRALQSALRADPKLPLAMVLADAAEALSHSRYA